MARLLFDENMPHSAVALVAAQGHDVMLAAHARPGANDLQVLAPALEQDRVLVTFDADFGDFIYQRGAAAPVAVIYLRVHPVWGAGAAALVNQALRTDINGQFIVATPSALRRRALPEHAGDERGT